MNKAKKLTVAVSLNLKAILNKIDLKPVLLLYIPFLLSSFFREEKNCRTKQDRFEFTTVFRVFYTWKDML